MRISITTVPKVIAGLIAKDDTNALFLATKTNDIIKKYFCPSYFTKDVSEFATNCVKNTKIPVAIASLTKILTLFTYYLGSANPARKLSLMM